MSNIQTDNLYNFHAILKLNINPISHFRETKKLILNKQCIDISLNDENIKETLIKHLVGYNGIIFSFSNLMKTHKQSFDAIYSLL